MIERYLAASKHKPATKKAYRRHLTGFMDRLEPDVSWQDCGSEDVVIWLQECVKSGLAPQSVNQALSAVRSFYKWAATEGLVDSNPASAVRQLSVSNPPKTPPTWAQILKVLSKEPRDRERRLICLASMGLQVEEVEGLSPVDLRLDEGFVLAGEGARRRRVEIPVDLERFLTEPAGEHVLQNKDGGALTTRSMSNGVRRAFKDTLGLESVGLKELRVAAARRCIELGGEKWAAGQLGCKNKQVLRRLAGRQRAGREHCSHCDGRDAYCAECLGTGTVLTDIGERYSGPDGWWTMRKRLRALTTELLTYSKGMRSQGLVSESELKQMVDAAACFASIANDEERWGS